MTTGAEDTPHVMMRALALPDRSIRTAMGWRWPGGPSCARGRALPPWMRAELVRLRAAFPEFSFGICTGWRGLTFEAWRDPGAGGVYAVITRDAAELWRELERSRDGLRPTGDTCTKEAR